MAMVEFDDLLPKINEDLEISELFSTGEAKKALGIMSSRNEIMESEGTIYKV